MDFLSHPAFWIVVAAASELIALSPLKSNSIVQLAFQVLNPLRPQIDAEIRRVNDLIDLEMERQKRRPVIKHEEPTPEQTGESRLLGGPMSISSPWNNDDPEPPAAS